MASVEEELGRSAWWWIIGGIAIMVVGAILLNTTICRQEVLGVCVDSVSLEDVGRLAVGAGAIVLIIGIIILFLTPTMSSALRKRGIRSLEHFGRRCANCGSTVSSDVKFCDICGSPLGETTNETKEASKFCKHCGKSTSVDSRYCEHCGGAV